MINCSKAFFVYPNGSIAHKIYNNVFWNNQNTVTGTTPVTSAVSMTSGSAQGANTIVSNNIMDVATNGNWGTAFVFNQINLSTTNTTASTGPQFANPTLIVGNSTGGTVETADWRLGLGSYLAGKGTVPTSPIDAITTDKAGITFLNPRAVGAYEYTFPSAVENIRNDVPFGRIVNNNFITQINGQIEIYNTTGMLIKNSKASIGQVITLSSGLYIAKAKTTDGLFVQEIIIK